MERLSWLEWRGKPLTIQVDTYLQEQTPGLHTITTTNPECPIIMLWTALPMEPGSMITITPNLDEFGWKLWEDEE